MSIQFRATASEGDSGAPSLHLNSVPTYFKFGPRLLHSSNIAFKSVPPSWFLPPLLRNPGDGSDSVMIRLCSRCGKVVILMFKTGFKAVSFLPVF